MKYLDTIKALLSLFPPIVQAVQAVEAAIPLPSAGKAKFDLVLSTIQTGYQMAEDTVVQFESIAPAISTTINSVVTAFNAAGIFKKAS